MGICRARRNALASGLGVVNLLEPAELDALGEEYRDALIAFEIAFDAGAAELLPEPPP